VGIGAILTLFLVSGAAPDGPELTDAQLAQRAEASFQEGRETRSRGESGKKEFQRAAADYDLLRQRGLDNPALYRNLAHAYVLADDLPQAILTLRRGLRLHPEDAGLREGLAQARELVIYPADNPLGQPAVEAQLPWLALIPLQWPFLAAFVCYCGLFVSGTRWLMTRHGRWLPLAALFLIVATGLMWLVIDTERRHHVETADRLVIINDDGVLLRKGDGLKFPARYITPVNRGVEAHLLNQRDNWVQVELAGGEVGWVPRNYVLLDKPEAN
jgi:hypothetical protein